MKYRFLTVVIILISAFSITVSAASLEYNISPDDSFIAVNRGDDLTQISSELDTTADELNTYFDKNGIEYFAVSKDTKAQIKISTYSNEFSKKVSDISLLDEDALVEFAKTFNAGSNNIINNNDRKFICLINNQEYSDGLYTVTQFITICDNKIVHFTGYNDGDKTSQEITEAFDTFTLNHPASNDNSTNYTLWIVLSIVGVVVFGVAAILIIVSIIKLKNTKEEEEIEQ